MKRHYKRQHKGKPFTPRELDDPRPPEEPDFISKKGNLFTSGDDNPSRKRRCDAVSAYTNMIGRNRVLFEETASSFDAPIEPKSATQRRPTPAP